MIEETTSDEEMAYYKLIYEAEKQSTSVMFGSWLYENYAIGNGDMLLSLSENTNVQETFLREHNLPLDTEL